MSVVSGRIVYLLACCCWLIKSVAEEVDSARVATVDLVPAGLVAESATSKIPPAFDGDVMLIDGTGDESRHEDVSEDAVAVLMAELWLAVDGPLPLLRTDSPLMGLVVGVVGVGGALVVVSSITVVIGPFELAVTSLLPGQRSLFLSSSLACSNENFFSMIAEKEKSSDQLI